MSSEPLVHIIDDDDAVRDSLSFLFASSGMAARTWDSPAAFLAHAAAIHCGCIVTDVRMPEMSGIDLVRRLKAAGSKLPVIVITGHGDVPLAVEAMKLGAADFLEKPFDDEALLRSVRNALAPVMANSADGETLEARRRIDQLSVRERQVLEGLIEGHANKVIAIDLEISPRTVEIYRAKVMSKMGAGSFAELIRMAMAGGVSPKGSAGS